MKRLILYLFLLANQSVVFSQAAAPITTIGTLAGVINESSGIEQTAPNRFFTHNDSGGQPDLYEIDSSGTLIRTIRVTNATNVDWEELAQDDSGRVYVGDFGNNNNNRSATSGNGLKIYRVNKPSTITGTTTVAGVINFEYADRNFSAPSSNHNFDMEGFFFFNDSLHLFSKNRTSPTNGWIKHYKLPSVPGTYTATVVDSFNNAGIRITAADISPNKKTVALLAENRIFLFYCYKGSKFISTGSNTVLTIPQTQKEAIVWVNDSTVFITEEGTGGKIFRSNLKSFIYKPLPVAITGASVTCIGTPVNLTAATASSFTWSTGSNSTSIVVSPTVTSSYSVTATDSKGCVSSSSKTVNVNPLPVILANTSSSLICSQPFQQTATLSASGAVSYTWNPGGVGVSIAVSPSVSTNYTVTGTDANGCINSIAITQSVSTCTGIDNMVNGTPELSVYPNPNNGNFSIKGQGQNETLTIINELGSMVQILTLNSDNAYTAEVNNLQPGIYFVISQTTRFKIAVLN
jgi:sugar lactone lactonase YvrE